MLKEITLDEIPEAQSFGNVVTPDGQFAMETLKEFIASPIMIAEVSGWPSGEPKTSKETSRYCSLIKQKIHKQCIKNINVMMRGRRMFLQKTIVYKLEGRNDG